MTKASSGRKGLFRLPVPEGCIPSSRNRVAASTVAGWGNSHLKPQAWSRESELEMPAPFDIACPSKAAPPKPPPDSTTRYLRLVNISDANQPYLLNPVRKNLTCAWFSESEVYWCVRGPHFQSELPACHSYLWEEFCPVHWFQWPHHSLLWCQGRRL